MEVDSLLSRRDVLPFPSQPWEDEHKESLLQGSLLSRRDVLARPRCFPEEFPSEAALMYAVTSRVESQIHSKVWLCVTSPKILCTLLTGFPKACSRIT